MTAALDLSPHLRAARRALLYLVVGLGPGPDVPAGDRRRARARRPAHAAVDRPAAAGRHRAARVAARRGRAPPGQPAAGDAPAAGPAARAARARRARGARPPRALARARRCCCSSCRSRSPGSCSPALPVLLAVALAGLGVERAGRATTGGSSARGRSARPSASRCACSRCPPTIVSIAALEGVGAAPARARPPAAALARGRGRAGARAAGRAPRRPLAQHRLLAARARDLRRRRRPPGRRCPTRAPAARGPRSSASGVRVAAIVHDAELDASPELVTAAASAAALAIDNERLKAELRARVEELRVSRLRIVEAADDARRRIERDLHDGAQQQLVSLALDLRMLKARLARQRARGHGRPDRREARGRARGAARVRARHPSRVPVRARRRRRGRGAGGARAAERRGARSSSTSACPRRSRPPPTSSSPRG